MKNNCCVNCGHVRSYKGNNFYPINCQLCGYQIAYEGSEKVDGLRERLKQEHYEEYDKYNSEDSKRHGW